MKRLICSNQGFALADILVSMLVMALLAGGIITMLVATSRTYVAGSVQQDSQQNGQLVLAYLAKQIEASPIGDSKGNIALNNNLTSYNPSNPASGSNQIAVFNPETIQYINGYWDYSAQQFKDQNLAMVSLVRFRFDPNTHSLYRDDFSNIHTGTGNLSDLQGKVPANSDVVATDLDNVIFTNAQGLSGTTIGSAIHIYVKARTNDHNLQHTSVYETTATFH